MNEIIIKIKKLLRKAEGTKNENEKIAFYQKAQELIIINDINENDLNQFTEVEIKKAYSEWKNYNFKEWYWKLVDVIATNHNCLYFRGNARNEFGYKLYRFAFIGEETKALISSLTINSLIMLLQPKTVSYRLGFIDGLKKEYEKTWEKYSLVPIVPVEAKKMYDEMSVVQADKLAQQVVSNYSEYDKGLKDGKKYTFNKIDGEKANNLMIEQYEQK